MAQAVSYGSITIVDTNDIESITIEYARNQSTSTPPAQDSSDWSATRPDWAQGYYIWQRARIHKSGTETSADTFGAAVCLTGSTGQSGTPGQSLIATKTQYTNAVSDVTINISNHTSYTWTDNVPEYNSAKPVYWGRITNTYSNPANTEYLFYKDNGLTEAIAKSVDANDKASQAVSIATDAQEDAESALSQATTLDVKLKNFFWPGDSNYPGAYAVGKGTDDGLDAGNISTYGYNLRLTPVTLSIGYNQFKAIEIDGSSPALKFYKPSKTTHWAQMAQLDANGLVLSEGGIEAGTKNSSDYIYIYSKDDATNHTLNINNSGNKSDWRIVAGNKFGVDKAGNLYASNANISGAITATSLTIGSGASVSGLSTSNISGIDNYALQSDLNTEIAQRKAVYAVSTTGATTAAKTTESGTPSGFVLYNGATVTVKFNSANSTTTPTLNVNGTGAKTIRSYTGAALTAAEYTWPAGAAITFTYDGSYWRMQDGGALQAKADAAASASSASSSASAASSSASSASTSASNASSSATAASNSASTASTKATEASNSASTASSKASAASTSATNAANSASAANTSATNASNSADAAASSASDASDSADAAAGSASTASSKATAAANSATSASNSASSASSSATSASNSASSASSSATTATNQANAAAGSATAASNSATAASGSATAASNSATAASNSATAASNSATAASNSATAAAEVMGGFTILWNYSAFGTSTAGDAFICSFDPATGTKSDANGWIKWNSTKRTITKQQVNPGTIVPYNIPIYIVCRLSSATGTTGTNYMVWYNSGWKYAACPSPTAVGDSWTWTDNKDIILGSFVETGANEVLTECELFNPPWTSKQITTNTTTPTSYIMDTDSNKGITVKPKDSSGNDFLQMNSTAIEFFRNSTTTSAMCLTDNSFRLGLEVSNHTTIDTSGLHIWTGTESTATNEVALFSSTARIGKQSSNNVSIEPGGIYLNNENGYSIFSAESSSSKTSVFTTDGPFSQTAGSHTATFSYTPVSGTQITAYIVFDSTRDIYDFTAGQSKTVTKTFGDEVYTIKYNGAKTITITANSSSLWCYVQYAYYYASVKAPVLTCGTDMRGENGRGAFSSAFGEGLEAASKHQFVVGKFNINDPTSFFEVGNGANNDDRNTAFKVMGDGYGQFTGSAATLDMLSADSNKVLRVLSNTNGNRGLYLPAEQKWIARADTNGAVYINGTNLTFPTSGAATLSRDLSTSGYISLSTNGKQIFFADKDNTNRSMIWLNGNNYFGLGYGMYEQNYGDTRIYGHNLRFYSHNTITMSQPLIVAGHDTAIGYVPNQASGKLSKTASDTDITKRTDAKLGLKAGSWVITGTARFTNNATGRRGINLYADSNSYEATFVTVPAATGATTKIQTTLVTVQSSDFTVYMGTQQNSGSQLDVDWYIRAIRIA